MVELIVNRKEVPKRLFLSGSAQVQDAASLAETLRPEMGESIIVDLSGLTDADLSFVQLMVAASREATSSGYAFEIDSSTIPEQIHRLLELCLGDAAGAESGSEVGRLFYGE